jgi:hypothetical protein
MSQQLNPVNGGVVPQIKTTPTEVRLKVLSPQYIDVNNLHSRPTEWVPGGRPIYRRLPATSETYQINFFNIVSESNVVPGAEIDEIGYVFVPYGDSINGPTSIEVVASDNLECLLIKAGVIVWKYGKTKVLPTIVNLRVLDVLVGKYDVAYQLIYDDSPVEKLYEVSDFALTGQPLNITSSTDSVIGWRYPAVNAFLNTDTLFWKTSDSYYPSYAQPSSSYLQWESQLTSSYSKVTLRCPPNTAYTGTATLYYVNDGNFLEVETVSVSSNSKGQYFEFTVDSPSFQTGWKVSFSSLEISIQSITVSGLLTLSEPQASPSPRATLVIYPSGTLPKFITNSAGKQVKATYCHLAEIDVGSAYKLLDIVDTRYVIHRDYTPVADWLTKPFDSDLTNLYEQVTGYSTLWMGPSTCMKQEYIDLETDQVMVEA